MNKRVGLAAVFFLLAFPAAAFEVDKGCDAPAAATSRRQFFVDPVHGSKTNDGSAQRPWRTLEEVMDPANHLVAASARQKAKSGELETSERNPGAPIRGGDIIFLLSGDHGSPILRQMVNSEFIEVAAAPGQTPVIESIRLIGSSHWLFRDLKFQGAPRGDSSAKGLIDLVGDDFHGPTDNVIIADSSVSTRDNVADWSDADWVKLPFPTGLWSRSDCVSILNNHFFHLRDAMAIMGDRSLVQGNLIDEVGNDGIDVTASDVTIRRNIIRDGHHTAAEPLHADGIQGWNLNGAANSNVVIDANTIFRASEGDDDNKYMQGISIFDGKWDGLTITNNLVATNTWHGIALYGVDNALVINNTVLPTSPTKRPTWITIHDSKDKRHSRNVVVRNNIAAQFAISGENVVVDHNIAAGEFAFDASGKVEHFTKGVIGDNNRVEPGIYLTLNRIDNPKGTLELRPKTDSPTIGKGNPELAPTVDISGRPRTSSMDIGAFAR